MIAQQLHIYPGKNVNGGQFSYQLDTDSGVLTTEGSVSVLSWPFTQNLPLVNVSKLDANLLLSSSVKVGEKINMGVFSLEVIAVTGNQAVCNVSVNASGVKAEGHAVINLSGQYIQIVSINATGSKALPMGSLDFELKVA